MSLNVGKIIKAQGPVVDVQFAADKDLPDLNTAIKIDKEAIWYPYPVLPLVPTPATASSWGWQLHRRVQLHRHHFYGNVFERRAKLEVSFAGQPQEVDGAGCPQAKPEGRGHRGGVLSWPIGRLARGQAQ